MASLPIVNANFRTHPSKVQLRIFSSVCATVWHHQSLCLSFKCELTALQPSLSWFEARHATSRLLEATPQETFRGRPRVALHFLSLHSNRKESCQYQQHSSHNANMLSEHALSYCGKRWLDEERSIPQSRGLLPKRSEFFNKYEDWTRNQMLCLPAVFNERGNGPPLNLLSVSPWCQYSAQPKS
eukprot:3530539-Amphidinium_carterae.1